MTYPLGDEADVVSTATRRGGGWPTPVAALDVAALFREQHANLVRLAALLVGDLPTAEVDGRLTPANLANGRVGRTLKIGTMPAGVEITPDGKTAYIATNTVVPNGVGILIPVSTATDTDGTPVRLPSRPWVMAVFP